MGRQFKVYPYDTRILYKQFNAAYRKQIVPSEQRIWRIIWHPQNSRSVDGVHQSHHRHRVAIILVVASLLGALASATWIGVIMSAFWKYYQAANILTYSVGIGLLLFIALLTIGYKAWHLGRINPVDTLRDE